MGKIDLLKQYKGTVSPAQVALGIQSAITNAQALLSDAELLLDNMRWARACALAILAIEEAGKPTILRSLLITTDGKELKQEWQSYRRHVRKNVAWVLPQLVFHGARKLEELSPIFDEDSDHATLLDSVKQIALYSDAYGDCHWSIPVEVVDEDLARTMVKIAKVLVPRGDTPVSSEAELQLWVKHLRPVWKSDMNAMKAALVDFYQEARDNGVLKGNHTPEEMTKFVGLERNSNLET